MRIELTVNGEPREADVWEGESLLFALRERLGLPGSKNACEQGECGSCSVLLDGDARVRVPRARGAGGRPRGRHGRGARARTASCIRVQQAFVEAGAVQCGFCTPGLVVATADLLARNPSPSDDEIREALSGNLCRCTGYAKIFDAVQAGASADAGAGARARGGPHESTAAPRSSSGASARASSASTAIPKVTGEFAYSSDLYAAGMLWGHTLRSPHAHARILEVDISEALTLPGVHAVLTHADVPGAEDATGSSSPTSRCSRSTACATSASRSRSSPPSIPSRRVARPSGSASSTSRSSRSSTWSARPSRRRSTTSADARARLPRRRRGRTSSAAS